MNELFKYVPIAMFMMPMAWLVVRQNKIMDQVANTYTKNETKELIDLKNKPMEDALRRNTEVSHELARAIQELKIELAKMNRD